MSLTDEEKHGFGVAINEASFVDVETTSITDGVVVVALRVMSWDDEVDEPSQVPTHVALSGVSRVAACLRHGPWDDREASIEPLGIDELGGRVRAMGPSDLYGWEYIDVDNPHWAYWRNRLSLDHRTGLPEPSHYLHLFKEQFQPSRTLDLRVWFEDLLVASEVDGKVRLDEFIRRGERWWTAMYEGDERTAASGIFRAVQASQSQPSKRRWTGLGWKRRRGRQ